MSVVECSNDYYNCIGLSGNYIILYKYIEWNKFSEWICFRSMHCYLWTVDGVGDLDSG